MTDLRVQRILIITTLWFMGCTSMPIQNIQLAQARADLGTMRADPLSRRLAAIELKQAEEDVSTAEAAWANNDRATKVDRLTDLARQRVTLAQDAVRFRSAEMVTTETEANRGRTPAWNDAGRAQRLTRAQEQPTAVQPPQNGDAQARNQALRAQLGELHARQTVRGLVVTLSDGMFNIDRDELKPEGLRSTDKLAAILKAHPQRNVSIESHTDSAGSNAHHVVLSQQRADAVRAALVDRGVYTGRITVHAYGKSHPVSNNEGVDGRRNNRRVEVILSDEDGLIRAR